jgi:hypothetical protein
MHDQRFLKNAQKTYEDRSVTSVIKKIRGMKVPSTRNICDDSDDCTLTLGSLIEPRLLKATELILGLELSRYP